MQDPWILLLFAIVVGLLFAVLFSLFRRVTVFEYQHGLRFVHGKLQGVLPAGSYWLRKAKTTVLILDARPRTLTVPGQDLLCSDGVWVKVSLLLRHRVVDPKAATLEAESYEEALYAAAQEALRVAVGEKTLDELLDTRAELGARLQAEVEPAAKALGLELQSLSVKDVMFAASLKEAFSRTARARQEAQALLERTRGETAALRNLANASRLVDKNPALFQLRLLQAASEGGKIVVNLTTPEGAGEMSGGEPPSS